MPTPLKKYESIRNNYCISYYGLNKEYLVQLKILRPIIENTYQGISIYICCSDNCRYILRNEKNIISRSELPKFKSEMAYVRNIEDSDQFHPIEELMNESDIPCGPIQTKPLGLGSLRCAVLTAGNYPVRSLSGKQIRSVEEEFNQYKIFINPKIEEIISDFEVVVGVENEVLYEAACHGVKTFLIPTGIGKNLFTSMFPQNKIFKALN